MRARVSKMAQEMVLVSKLSEKATVPTRGSAEAAGLDLYAAHDAVIPAAGKGLVKTDLAMQVPLGTYGRVAPRSGLAWKKHVDVGAGVIDRDYRGNVGVVLFNHAQEDLEVKVGDRIAQLVLEKVSMAPVREVESLDESARGEGGFGSTGVSKDETPAATTETETGAPEPDAKRAKLEASAEEAMENLLVALAEVSSLDAAAKTKLRQRVLAGDAAVLAVGRAHARVGKVDELVENLLALPEVSA
ncbi:Deoxyuridine 5'-triphosphate nucleotidohydrolase [Hondaea fermentalgiana]|uniref:Deoxyuridine 5'-triphosphate nucleotidohydrolase n=1 Tax=Hondaea fermentalgiana TaxID=2315210 RepID=A0A2R5GQR2_9STRA|nr:Deoxyuridine 5'-triphosphate nucleotidohydrolase [Hondaea fermentalgiana]|eukprot:GBG32098.1 Deoxyuridine 5'-triphosphate nucleotidohydrolase [Hondaea fermentalgiana]